MQQQEMIVNEGATSSEWVFETMPDEGMKVGKEKIFEQLDFTRSKAKIVATLG
jgi:hypothetical protein